MEKSYYSETKMIFYIGQDVLYEGKKYHVQDTNYLNSTAKIGIPDGNGLIWDTIWIGFKDLKEIENKNKIFIKNKTPKTV